MSIISIVDLELYLQKTIVGTSDQDKYEALIGMVQSLSESICNRQFEAQDLDETFDMDGQEVTLNQSPVNSVTTVSYGSPFGTVDRTELHSTQYLRYDDIGVLRLSIVARRSPQFVRVVYNAGYGSDPSAGSLAPDDLKQILMDQIETSFITKWTDATLKSDKFGDAKVEYFSSSDLGDTSNFAMKLSKYVRSDI